MPVSKEQAQMLTTLAIDCRPTGARHWDPPGVMAAISRVKDWNLAEAITEVITAAADRACETPGVIGKVGPHRKPAEVKPAREPYDPRLVCHICGKPKHATTDHAFLSVEANRARETKPAPESIRGAIAVARVGAGEA